MINIDLTYGEFALLSDNNEYLLAVRYSSLGKAVNHYKVDFGKLTFEQVKDLQYYADEGFPIELMNSISGVDIIKEKFFKVAQFEAYIRDEVRKSIENENEMFKYMPTMQEINAGIENFAKYSFYPQFRELAITFHKLPNEVGKLLTYNEAITELLYQKELRDFEKTFISLQK